MASGLLSGSFTAARAAALDDDDWRRRHPDFTGNALARNLALADALGPIASHHGVTVAAVAVAWTLAFPGVTGAIVGVRRAAQLDAWLPAASLALDDSDLTRIADAIERTGAGSGPALPVPAA
jgi:aryl-alcohol dehydrogenase-like predicted oxidoreductase